MKLQTNTLLAIYSVIEFAAEPERHIAAAEIAAKHSVSAHHLAKVLSELARANVVESVRGVGGGYRFAGNARRLTLMDIILIFEDLGSHAGKPRPSAPATHTRGRGTPARAAASADSRSVEAALGEVLGEIDDIARATFSSITIATMLLLVERQRERSAR